MKKVDAHNIFYLIISSARDVISLGVASAAPLRSTANLPCRGYFPGLVHGRKQQRRTSVVSVVGTQNCLLTCIVVSVFQFYIFINLVTFILLHFQFGRKTKITRETVVPDPDYRLPIAILGERWR
jgi:hypothetical protein